MTAIIKTMRPIHRSRPTLMTHSPMHRISNKYKRVWRRRRTPGVNRRLPKNQRNGIKITTIIKYKNLIWISLIVTKSLIYSIRLLHRLRINYKKNKTKTSQSSIANTIGRSLPRPPPLTSQAAKITSLIMSYKWWMLNRFKWVRRRLIPLK